MADITKYEIDYSAPPSKVLADLAKIDAALAKTQAGIAKTGSMLKSLGQNSPGVTKMIGELKRLDVELRSKVKDSAAAEAGLKKVGQGNSAVTSLTKRLKDLEVELAAVTAAAALAAAASAGVGNGGGAGGGGGGGGGGKAAEVSAKVKANRIGVAVGAGVAYASFRAVMGSSWEGIQANRAFYRGAADTASDYRKDLAELAVLKGKPADDDLMREDLAFQKETLLNPDESRTFRLEFGGSVDASLKANGGKNITPEVAKELEKKAGLFTKRYNLDPVTGGRMAGLLGINNKVPTATAGVGILAETMEQLNVAGVGKVKDLATSMFQLSGGMRAEVNDESLGGEAGGGGRFKSDPEMAARYAASSVATVGGARAARTRIIQSDRLLRKLARDKDSEMGKKANISPDDDYETAINKLAPHIAGPKGYDKLYSSGYHNSDDLLAVITEAKLNGTVAANVKDPRMARARVEAELDAEKFKSSDVGQQAAAENRKFAAVVDVGMKGQKLKTARANAEAELTEQGRLKPRGMRDSTDNILTSQITGNFGSVSGDDIRVDRMAIGTLEEEGKAAGVDIYKNHPRLKSTYSLLGLGSFDKPSALTDVGSGEGRLQGEFAAAREEVDAAKALRQVGAAANNAATAMERDRAKSQGGANRPAKGPPAPPPAGNGGSGVNPGRR